MPTSITPSSFIPSKESLLSRKLKKFKCMISSERLLNRILRLLYLTSAPRRSASMTLQGTSSKLSWVKTTRFMHWERTNSPSTRLTATTRTDLKKYTSFRLLSLSFILLSNTSSWRRRHPFSSTTEILTWLWRKKKIKMFPITKSWRCLIKSSSLLTIKSWAFGIWTMKAGPVLPLTKPHWPRARLSSLTRSYWWQIHGSNLMIFVTSSNDLIVTIYYIQPDKDQLSSL